MIRIVQRGEDEIVLRTNPRGQHLCDLHPFLLVEHWNNEESSQGQAESQGGGAHYEGLERTPDDGSDGQQQRQRVGHHDRGRDVGQPGGGHDQGQREDCFPRFFFRRRTTEQEEGQQRANQQFRKVAAPVDDNEVIGIGGVQGSAEDGVASRQITARQQEHGDARERQSDPLINAGHDFPGQERSQGGAQHPRCRRIEDEAGFAVSEVGQACPTRIENAEFPLAQYFHPGVHVKFEVVAGGNSQEKCGHEDGEGCECDDRTGASRRAGLPDSGCDRDRGLDLSHSFQSARRRLLLNR